MDMSIWKIIQIGGLAMWVIVGLSVLALAVALERAATLWGFTERARLLADTVNRCLFRGAVAEARAACERSKSPVADIFLVGFERAGRAKPEHVDAAVDRMRQRVSLDLRTRLWMLGTIGAMSPFIGLYGTVVGIMNAFRAISSQQGGGFTVVSQGISEALVTTAAGIAVGIIAVVLYNAINQRLARINVEMKLIVEEFLEVLKETGVEDGGRQST
jgi:biopolymer transport protein ExbB/TolQ